MDLRELYQETILDHSKRPRNFSEVANANCRANGHNPLCGDKVSITALVNGDRLEQVGFQGSGCAICTASASLMTEAVKGLTKPEIEAMYQGFHELVAGKAAFEDKLEDLGKLAVFSGVREFPIRVKCATLPWHTLRAALQNQDQPVSTE